MYRYNQWPVILPSPSNTSRSLLSIDLHLSLIKSWETCAHPSKINSFVVWCDHPSADIVPGVVWEVASSFQLVKGQGARNSWKSTPACFLPSKCKQYCEFLPCHTHCHHLSSKQNHDFPLTKGLLLASRSNIVPLVFPDTSLKIMSDLKSYLTAAQKWNRVYTLLFWLFPSLNTVDTISFFITSSLGYFSRMICAYFIRLAPTCGDFQSFWQARLLW